MAVTAREDTFPKLIALNAQIRPARIAFRHKDFGIWQSWNWHEVTRMSAPSRRVCRPWD